MVRKLGGLLKKDIKIAYRNFFFIVVVITAVILILLTNFVLPKEISTDSKITYYIEAKEEQKIIPLVKFLEMKQGSIKADSRDEVIQKMKKDQNMIGMVLKVDANEPLIEFIMQGHESEKAKRALDLSIKAVLDMGMTGDSGVRIVELKGNAAKNIPFNLWLIPLMLLTEPLMLGFVLIAVLVFMEKEEGTTESYMVSPGRIPEYLGSKIILMIILGLISTFLITVFTVGFNVNWLMLTLVVVVGSIFGSALGLLLASFFDTVSKSMMWLLTLSVLMMMPQVSYFVPSFAPSYLTWMPTYSLLFAVKEAVFPSGNPGIIYSTLAVTGGTGIILYLLSVVSFRRTLVRD